MNLGQTLNKDAKYTHILRNQPYFTLRLIGWAGFGGPKKKEFSGLFLYPAPFKNIAYLGRSFL